MLRALKALAITVVLTVLVIACLGMYGPEIQRLFTPAAVAPQAITSKPGVTYAQYQQLNDGMTLKQAINILGNPSKELSRSSIGDLTTVMFMWEGAGSATANMNAMFQAEAGETLGEAHLVTKAQFNLK